MKHVAEIDVIEAVAAGADFPIDLETALKLRPVELTERAFKAEIHIGKRRAGAAGREGAHGRGDSRGEGAGDEVFTHWAYSALSMGFAVAPAGAGPPPRTGDEMLSGTFRVFSNRGSNGMITRKNAK